MSEARQRALRLVPKVVAGRYEPVARIASGGMATVYLAKSTVGAGFEKLVALKCVHPHMAERSDFVTMFLDEARIASRIDHPNVCHVFDAGEDDGTYFIAMEYLHGESLAHVMRAWGERPPANRIPVACRMLADAAMGLHAAHELRGPDGSRLALVHRDVSPQNLFVTYAGAVKVVDFGIAKAHGRLHETTTGVVRGKVAYMSPEQASAEELDARTDVWALGVTLWELLTLRRLFRRDEQLSTLRAVLEEPVDPPSKHAPEIPAALDQIVLRALERDRGRRTPSARAFADELNAYLASESTHVGMSELSDCMSETFSEAILEKEAFKRLAETTPSATRLRTPSEPQKGAASEPPTMAASTSHPAPSESIALPMRGRGRGWVVAGSLAALVGLGAGIAVVLKVLDPPPAEVAEAPAPELPEPTEPPAPPAAPATEEPAPAAEPPPSPEVEPLPPRSPSRAASAAPPPAPAPAHALEPGAPAASSAPRPAPVTAAPPPVVAAPRALRIVHPTGGWAELRVDGRPQRNTPISLAAVRPGPHLIELRPYGAGAWIQHRVVIPAGAGAHVLRFAVPPPP